MSIEAMKQALEVLENFVDDPRSQHQIDAASAALRQAIAEAEQEPVVPICPNCLGTKRPHKDDPEWVGRCDCTPPQQKRPQNCGTSFCSCIECVMEPEPKPSPLTVDEIWRNDRIMSLNADLGLGIDDWIKIVDAVEAAHGIKENT